MGMNAAGGFSGHSPTKRGAATPMTVSGLVHDSSGGALSTPSLPAIQPPLHASATLNAASGVRSDRGMTEP